MKPWRACAWLAGATLVACGSFRGETDAVDSAADDGGSDATTDTSSNADARSPTDAAASKSDAADGGGSAVVDAGPGRTAVYPHSYDSLYRFEPATMTLELVGTFDGCNGGATDIAIDALGRIVAVNDMLYDVDPTTGACTSGRGMSEPVTLTFVGPKVFDAGQETLVAHAGYQYERIERTTGIPTTIGSNALSPYTPSGDLVTTPAGELYATVLNGTECVTGNCLLRLDPGTGTPQQTWFLTSYGVVGLAYWKGHLYGFLNDGTIDDMTFSPDGGVNEAILYLDGGPPQWKGAGSTRAPL